MTRRQKIWLTIVLLVGAINAVAYRHAWRMTHFVAAGRNRNVPPGPFVNQRLAPDIDVVRVLLGGVPATHTMLQNPWHTRQMHDAKDERFLWIEIGHG